MHDKNIIVEPKNIIILAVIIFIYIYTILEL